jgi:hypothetical protein
MESNSTNSNSNSNSNEEKMAYHQKIEDARALLKKVAKETQARVIAFAANAPNLNAMNKKRWENFVKMTNPHKHIEELMEDCVFNLDVYQDVSEKVNENAQKLGPVGSYAWDEFVIEVTQRLFDDGKYNHEFLDNVDEGDAEWIDMVCDVVCKLLEEKEFN